MADSTRVVSGLRMKAVVSPKVSVPTQVMETVAVRPNDVIMPKTFEDWFPKYAAFSTHPDDVWVITFPKSGTTWAQEIVWCLLHGLKSPDIELHLMKRFPFFEFDSLVSSWASPPSSPRGSPLPLVNSWNTIQEQTSPRTIKSHLPKELLPNGLWLTQTKMIYVCRDPRDVCISYYFHQLRLQTYKGTKEDFVQALLDDILCYSPFWPHLLAFWEMRNEEHILFLRYEDMQKDLKEVIQRVADFLEVKVNDEEVISLAHHCSFDQMKDNPATNNELFSEPDNTPEPSEPMKFMRSGKIGDWKNHLTEKQAKAFQEWTERSLDGSDFPYYRDYE